MSDNADRAHRDQVILDHYRDQAQKYGLRPSSTMLDATTRDLEVEAVLSCVRYVCRLARSETSLLEIGCGNGYLLNEIRNEISSLRLTGVDFSPEMVDLVSTRAISNCAVLRNDVRALSFSAKSFDAVVSERCLINLLDLQEKAEAIGEIHRVLKPDGLLILIEAFTDGYENLNRARGELGLEPLKPPHHNQWFDKDSLDGFIRGRFDVVREDPAGDLPPRNFLSSHYFVSRVLYPAITRREVVHNTEFVKFFRLLPPQGQFSPVQLYFLRKRQDSPAHS